MKNSSAIDPYSALRPTDYYIMPGKHVMESTSPEYVAEALVRAVGKNQRTVILPRMLHFFLIMYTIFPRLIEWLMYRTGWQRQATKATS